MLKDIKMLTYLMLISILLLILYDHFVTISCMLHEKFFGGNHISMWKTIYTYTRIQKKITEILKCWIWNGSTWDNIFSRLATRKVRRNVTDNKRWSLISDKFYSSLRRSGTSWRIDSLQSLTENHKKGL